MNLRGMLGMKPKKLTLVEAAKNLLRWNLKGQSTGAVAKRGVYIRQREEESNCYACKIGLVMLGRYGKRAMELNSPGYPGYSEVSSKVREIKKYGPRVECPCPASVNEGDWCYYDSSQRVPLGEMIEHLFEDHRWSVMRIDKWLARLAELDLKREWEKAGMA